MSETGFEVYAECLYSIAEAWGKYMKVPDHTIYIFFLHIAEARRH